MKTIIITGASSGIGWATALALDHSNHHFILCGRRKDRLEELAASLNGKASIHCFDIRNAKEVSSATDSILNSHNNIDILVNNAGGAHGLEPLSKGSFEDWDTMIDSNLKGLLYISKPIMNQMMKQNAGHIVNVSSIAGKETYPNGVVYCACKSAVESVSKGMRMELNPYGIRVTNIAPGAVETEFSVVRFKGNQEKANQVYKGFLPLKAEDIASTIAYAVNSPDHVQIADVLVFPSAQSSATRIEKTSS